MNFYTKAVELFEIKQWNAARTLLEKGLSESTENAEAHHLLGVILYLQGFFQASVKHLEKAKDIKNYPEYFLNLGIVLNEIGKYAEGEKHYYKALQLRKRTHEQNWKEQMAGCHLRTAKAYGDKKQFKKALQECIKALDLQPQHIKIQMKIADLLWKAGKKEMALDYLKKIISLNPKLSEARLVLANWYFSLKQIPSAVNEWESVLYLQPENKEAKQALERVQQLSAMES